MTPHDEALGEDLLTPEETAKKLKVSRRTLNRITKERELPVVLIRSLVRYRRGDVDAYIARQLVAAGSMEEEGPVGEMEGGAGPEDRAPPAG